MLTWTPATPDVPSPAAAPDGVGAAGRSPLVVNAAGGTDVPQNAVTEGPEGASDDACIEGHTHLAERGFEGARQPVQLGRLVDAGVADPQHLAAAGESYGGGQTWLLATAMPWKTVDGTVIQLAVAVASAGWTDLYGSFAPNGRATDDVDQMPRTKSPSA